MKMKLKNQITTYNHIPPPSLGFLREKKAWLNEIIVLKMGLCLYVQMVNGVPEDRMLVTCVCVCFNGTLF